MQPESESYLNGPDTSLEKAQLNAGITFSLFSYNIRKLSENKESHLSNTNLNMCSISTHYCCLIFDRFIGWSKVTSRKQEENET